MEESGTNPIVICDAASQNNRRLKALQDDYACPDDRSLADLLNFGAAYGSLINFYDLSNQVEGDWQNFFQRDPSIVLASMAQVDLARSEAEFIRLKALTRSQTSFHRKFELLKDTFGVCYGLAFQANSWLRWLQVVPENSPARLVGQAIVSVVESELAMPLQTLKAYDEGAGLPGALGRRIGFDYGMFCDLWRLGNVRPDGSIYSGATPNRKIDRALPFLDAILYAFLHGVAELQRSALANFAASMADSGDHSPNSALYIAFARLFQTAQHSINSFSSRYSRFYYRDILREKYLGALADSLYLTFTLAASEKVLDATVHKGTLFSAGPDADGMDILYAADRSLLVTAAAVARLLTLRVVQGPLLSAQTQSQTPPPSPDVLQRIFSSTILLREDGTPGPNTSTSGLPEPWATFGETRARTTQSEVTEPATLGFALASNYLLLTGGVRKVTLLVQYSSPGLPELLTHIAQVTGLHEEEIFLQVLNAAFKLYVSTDAGWLLVEKYEASPAAYPNPEATGFRLYFELPPSAPAVVAYDPEDGEGAAQSEAAALAGQDADLANPAPSLPTLKAYLRQEPVCLIGNSGSACVYPLSLLAAMGIIALELQTEVNQLAGMQLENTDGPIDPSAPFYVFGGLPVVGSYFLLRHQELFAKELGALTIGIEWFNLPQNDDGFKGYYRDYVLGLDGKKQPGLFDNQVFHAALSVLNPGSWFLTSDPVCPQKPFEPLAPPVPVDAFLFRTKNDCSNPVPAIDGPLCPASNFHNFKVCPYPLPPYYDASASAIKLALAAPKYAFGADLYAQNVLYAVIADLPNADLCQEKCDAQCKFLAEAAQWVGHLLDQCQDVPDGEYRRCIQPQLTACLTKLLVAFAECLVECFIRNQNMHDAQGVAGMKASLDRCLLAEGKQRAQLLKDFQARWGGALNASDCGNRCLPLLQAAACIAECEIGCGIDENFKQCMQKCLAGCQESLQQAHDLCLKACMAACMKVKKELKYPNDPYVPQATSATVDYRARCSFIGGQAGRDCGIFFHLLPFGGYRQFAFPPRQSPQELGSGTQAPASTELPALLPQFAYAGALYLGFSGLTAPQKLNLLFQMAAAGAQDLPYELPPVQWDRLSANRWVPLQPAQRVADSTNGLQNTGIVALDVPAPQSGSVTILPGPCTWLRAAVASDAGAFPPAIAIYPHALTSTWQDNGGAYDHLKKPLPAYTVSSSVQDLPDVQTIDQPLESFGGRPPETEQTFYVRVGERLRHKDRAVLGWDHERLVLERFPTIWKVHTLPARNPHGGHVPGSVLVLVIAGPESNQLQDPTVPMASSAMLAQIKSYLQSLASPFIQIQVVNPVYVRIKVNATVQFQDQEDAGDCITRLNNELVEYLSPWFHGPSVDGSPPAVENRQCISEDGISGFIQTRPYVLALDSIAFIYDPDPVTLEWYWPTSAKQHEIHDANTVSAPAPDGSVY
ncbi:MAG TPA: hypothetical protein VF532_21955 [Candidatus Angelobacter sp.]